VAFEEMGRAAVSRVDRALGSPWSLPGSLWARFREGTPLADYESLYMRRPYSRFLVWLGEGDRMFLEDGWSEPRPGLGLNCRVLAQPSAGLVIPLHRAAPYQLGARLRSVQAGGLAPNEGGPPADGVPPVDDGAVRVRVLVNGRPLGAWTVAEAWTDQWLDVPADALRPGRNQVRFRVVEGTGGTLAVASVWMEPAIVPAPAVN
jgi:hypothetical protein